MTTDARIESELYQLSADGDEWGNVMAHWFGIATALYAYGHPVPDEWDFRPSPMLHEGRNIDDWPDAEYLDMLREGSVTPESLVSFANDTLAPERDRLKSEGLDY